MYAVSDAYKEAINGRSRQFKIRAVISFRDSTTKTFDDSTVEGEVMIESQMMPGSPSDDMIKLGMAAAKKLTMTVKNIKTDLHVFSGARVLLYVSLQLKNGGYEEVPMGKFRVDSKSISRVNDLVTFSAYDDMVLLHYELTDEMREELSGKTAIEAARILCAGLVTVGSAVSPEGKYIECPNSDIPLDFSSPQVETARDGIMWIAQVMGCFARINRLGVLEFVPIMSWWKMYTETTGTILAVRNIGGAQRIRTKFADDRIHIVGVSMRGADGKLVTQRYSYSNPAGGDPTSDVTVEMESNPLIMNGSTPLTDILANILAQVSTAYFYAFSTDIPNDPALDEGDTIRLQGGIINGTNHNNDLIGFITHNVWRYRGIQEITNASSVPIIFGGEDGGDTPARSRARSAKARSASASSESSSADERNYLPPRPQSEKALQGVNLTELVGNFNGRYSFKWVSQYEMAASNPKGKRVFSFLNNPGGGINLGVYKEKYGTDQMEDVFNLGTSGGVFQLKYNKNCSIIIGNDYMEVTANGKRLLYLRNDGYVEFGSDRDFWANPTTGIFKFRGFEIDNDAGIISLNGQTVFKTS